MNDTKTKKRGHAIGLFSGGLDSALAVLLMLKQDIEVTAITFMTHFGCDLGDRSSCGSNPYPAAEKYGFNVKLMHLGQKFVNIVQKPKYGYGKNMNPCTDCRILMLSEAKELMEMTNADFIFTGEVMGQRPMSQVKDKLNLVEKVSGLKGKLLRPLCAKLLKPTDAEISGMIDREQLEGISGRGRHRQIELAKEFNLEDYPNPASGCLLTDSSYSIRLKDLLLHTDHLTFDELNLLRLGRHFRLDDKTKIIIGRNENENKSLWANKKDFHVEIHITDVSSQVTLLIGEATDENIIKAGALTARYTKAKNFDKVNINIIENGTERQMEIPLDSEDLLKPLIAH
jgi:tRNA U34 2-thiouridine synthase MnmA/TrmU